MNLPTTLPTDSRTLQVFVNQAVNENLDAASGNFIAAYHAAKATYPDLFAAATEALRPPNEDQGATRIVPPSRPSIAPVTPADDKNKFRTFNPATFRYESAVGNAMNDDQVRKTYQEAFQKHVASHPEDHPLEVHRAILAAHPTLAAAFKRQRKASAGADDQPDDGEKATLANNRRTVLANSAENFTGDDVAVACEAVALANDMSRRAGVSLSAMVFTAAGPRMAESILANAGA